MARRLGKLGVFSPRLNLVPGSAFLHEQQTPPERNDTHQAVYA
jgi:hypothetical protein